MCIDPYTALMIGGATLSAVGSISQGESGAEAGKLQRQAYEQQVQSDAAATAFEVMQTRKQHDRAAASARAQVGASGVALTGSPSEVLTDRAGEAQLDVDAIVYGSKVRQSQLRTQGKIAEFQGQQARTGGYINAASGFVSGITPLYDPRRAVKFGQNQFAKPNLAYLNPNGMIGGGV